ncbi:MAG: double-strand break repair protein AddB [Pseudomonadota bacterium]
MFERTDKPRVFAVPPGVDFPAAVVRGLTQRLADQPPHHMVDIELIMNTRRMTRRVRELFDDGPALLLPRLSLLTDLARWVRGPVPQTIPPLRRRLELAQLVARLIERQPDLAARSAVYDLAESLADLINEMQGEGVDPATIRTLDVSDMSGHWARSLSLIAIAEPLFVPNDSGAMDSEARQRWIVETLIRQWETEPPETPFILAGSTGSRGTTQLLMQAIARLPQGAVILPGYDFDQPSAVWDSMDDALAAEDHPQFRFHRLVQDLGITPGDVVRWSDLEPHAPARNRAVSLALRPAPVTDAWMREGPELAHLDTGFSDVTLIEAPDPRTEALSIALRLRQAAEDGQRAALITPDRMLTRQVAAALDRWRIVPDDSAGVPLYLSPAGRFLRQVAGLFTTRLTAEMLIALLKHPLTHSGAGRNVHLLLTRDLELHIRRRGLPWPDAPALLDWAGTQSHDSAQAWGAWAAECFADRSDATVRPLAIWTEALRGLAECVASGPDGGPNHLWSDEAGETALSVLDALADEAASGGDMSAAEFSDLIGALLAAEEVRNPIAPHPGIMIWGTLEARVQGADLLILGGLNEGTWPEAAKPDPWLNRALRHQAGLLLPDRRIGLSAHDFQQAVAGHEVWMTRSIRSDDAETVASRWVNRLTNLLDGLPEADGPGVLRQMRVRGDRWCAMAAQLDKTDRAPPASRPSPKPPVDARPRQLSVTEIKTLIRDPYAVYARRVLRLNPLDPLLASADALSRGVVLHEVLEAFVRETSSHPDRLSRDHLMKVAREIVEQSVPWQTAQRLWLARIDRFADWFVRSETERQRRSHPVALEAQMRAVIDDLGFALTGKADRVDRDDTGALHIFDYKTSRAPTRPEQQHFDKQLLLEAAIAEQVGLGDIPPSPVAQAVFIGLGAQSEVPAPLESEPVAKIWAEFSDLIRAYLSPDQGFTARRMPHKDSDTGPYDQLARFGEWDRSTTPTPEDLS